MTREQMKQTAKECRIANVSTKVWDSGVDGTFVAAHEQPNRPRSDFATEDAWAGELARRARRARCQFKPAGGPRSKRCTCGLDA